MMYVLFVCLVGGFFWPVFGRNYLHYYPCSLKLDAHEVMGECESNIVVVASGEFIITDTLQAALHKPSNQYSSFSGTYM